MPEKQPPRPTVRIEKVTPAMADKWLSGQERNREIREPRVLVLVDLIKRGEWRLTNDCITFDVEGRLTNGQHRCAAIYLGGVPVEVAVMRNLPADTQDVMDTGLARRTRDALQMRDEKNAFTLAGGLRWEHRLRYIETLDKDADNVHYSSSVDRATTLELLAIFDEERQLWRDMASIAQNLNRQAGLRTGLAAAALHRFWVLSPEDGAAFVEALITGANLGAKHPILQLRNALNPQRRTRTERMADYREMALTCKAWNLWRDGDERGNLTWHFGGAHREPFPIPR